MNFVSANLRRRSAAATLVKVAAVVCGVVMQQQVWTKRHGGPGSQA